MTQVYDAAVIGGGAFGCAIAAWLRRRMRRVILLEERGDLCQRASYANQARVHNGYHYPRHLPTAARSAVGFRRFVAEFADCVDRSFTKVYAIARQFSKVRADYFAAFCRQIGSPCRPASEAVVRLFDREAVEAVFEVEEFAFDAVRLKERLQRDLAETGVEVRLRTAVHRVTPGEAARVRLAGGVEANDVFNCTYSGLNNVLLASDLPPLPLKHELAELAIVEAPAVLRRLGVTVMCGPFFSCMPFPPLGLHSLSHVRYTPHCQWSDINTGGAVPTPLRGQETRRETNFGWMVRDAARYLPLLNRCAYRSSLFETKTVLVANEGNDGRPILFRRDHGLPGLHCVLGGKIDNIFDMTDELDVLFAGRAAA